MTISSTMWRALAVAAGVLAPLMTAGVAHADPFPPPLPQSGQPIPLVVEPPTLFALSIPPSPNGCDTAIAYNNPATPLVSDFQGQTACGSGVVGETISDSSYLTDVFGQVVAYGSNGSASGSAVATSSGTDWSPIPGMEYTVNYHSAVTLAYPQVWGTPASGCTISGETMYCDSSTTYSYIPGTAGGFVFS